MHALIHKKCAMPLHNAIDIFYILGEWYPRHREAFMGKDGPSEGEKGKVRKLMSLSITNGSGLL